MAIRDVQSLREHLQWAITIETSLIPIYLYGMYSIKDMTSEPFLLIRSVVAEEMLHAALDANMLVAVGGDPSFYENGPARSYPVPMPHHDPPLPLELSPITDELLDLFILIEKPRPTDGVPEDDNYETQGQFYLAIDEGIERLGDEIFADPHLDRQLSDPSWYGVVEFDAEDSGGLHAITDVASADRAIQTVIHQGEGLTEELWADPEHKELTHYHKFLKCKEEGVPDGGLWPLAVNPRVKDYPDDIRAGAEFFNAAYSATLILLDLMYQPLSDTERGEFVSWLYRLMIDVMGLTARKLVTRDLGDGTHAGPTFEVVQFQSVDSAFDELKAYAERALAAMPDLEMPVKIVHEL